MKKFYIRKYGNTWFSLDGEKFDNTVGLDPVWAAGWTAIFAADLDAAKAVGKTIDHFSQTGLYDRAPV